MSKKEDNKVLGFGGHADDMNVRFRNNLIPRKRYRARHQKMYDALTKEYSQRSLNVKEFSKEEHESIKAKIRRTIKREEMLAIIKTAVVTIIIALVVFLLFYQNAKGQGIVSEENKWNVLAGDVWSMGTETYMIDGDSVMGDTTYKAIWQTNDSIKASWMFQGLLREDSNVVFFREPGADQEGILYDFNLEQGDTAYITNKFCWGEEIIVTISAIDTAEYFGIQRRRWHLETDFSGGGIEEYWIEGIGSNFGVITGAYYMCIACPTWDLLCFHQNDNLLYSMNPSNECYIVGIEEDEIKNRLNIYPNPASNKLTVKVANSEIEKVELFDMMGTLVMEYSNSENTDEIELDIRSLTSGTYFCRIYVADRTLTEKIIVR